MIDDKTLRFSDADLEMLATGTSAPIIRALAAELLADRRTMREVATDPRCVEMKGRLLFEARDAREGE